MPTNQPMVTIEKTVVEKMKSLPPGKKTEVLDFIEFLQHKASVKHKHRGLKGLWADLGIKITEKDVADVRKEMWGKFPKEVF